jgi:hypothetical protein
VENVHCHYLIPGTVVQVIKEDPAKGMSQIWVGGITTPLWTYTRFLSKHPVRDTYGNIEMPEERGLTPKRRCNLPRSLLIIRQLGLGRTEIRRFRNLVRLSPMPD